PAADAAGNIYYTAIRVDPSAGWRGDVRGAWLVRVASDGAASVVPFSAIVTGAPAATSFCFGAFDPNDAPLPPSPGAVPPLGVCGSQRPGLNVTPAIAPDGTIYVISRAHFNNFY